MRSCVVEKCTNTDNIILCHRFPKNRNIAKKWQISLNLKDYQIETLMSKYVVCCQHFDDRDYRNSASNCLNSTALPKLNVTSPRPYSTMCTQYSSTELRLGARETENQGSPSPLNESDSIELLNRDDCDDTTESSTSNSRNMDKRDRPTDALAQSMDATDFTMLDANGCTMYVPFEPRSKSADAADEHVSFTLESQDSSDNSNDYRPRSTDDFRPCSTDSDVEVLESEAIYESQNSQRSCNRSAAETNYKREHDTPVIPECSDKGSKLLVQHMTIVNAEYEHLDRYQLIDIIKNQSTQIEDLQKKLDKYKIAHDHFFTHFDAFRSSVCDPVIM